MGAIAVFSYETWNASYPEFSNVSAVQAQAFWNEATLIWRNDGGGPIQDATQQGAVLNLLTAHIAFLSVGTAGNPSAASQGLVGRVTSASQGSVSVSTELPPGIDPYLAQSEYGIRYWWIIRPFRTFRYFSRASGHRLPW